MSGHDTARRVRAARGWSGLSQIAVAAQIGMSVETLSRMENGHRKASIEELRAIGNACGVPRAFMERGFTQSKKSYETYEVFVAALEERPEGLTPLSWTAQQAPDQRYAAWLDRWVRERLVENGEGPHPWGPSLCPE